MAKTITDLENELVEAWAKVHQALLLAGRPLHTHTQFILEEVPAGLLEMARKELQDLGLVHIEITIVQEPTETREHWRTMAYTVQHGINRRKMGPGLTKLLEKSDPVVPADSGRGTLDDWRKFCGLLDRYMRAYTGGRPPTDKLIDDMEKFRQKMWD